MKAVAKAAGIVLALAVLVLLLWSVNRQPAPVLPVSAPAPKAEPATSSTVVPGLQPIPVPLQRVEAEAGHVQLPDGSYLPNLNGVKGSAKLEWVGPFPAVIGKIRNAADGVEWYVLENGDRITTVNRPGTAAGQPVRRDLVVHVRSADVVK